MKGYQWSTYVIEKECAFKHETYWSLWEFQVDEWSKERKLINAVPNTETVSYGSGYAAAVAVFLPGNIMAIVFCENICLFTQLKQQKAHRMKRGHSLFIPMKG